MHSASVPTAGTVVTEMNTPTSGPDLEVVSASTPATPASSAIRNDQMSGWTMKSVCGPVAASALVARPTARATEPQRRRRRPRRWRSRRRAWCSARGRIEGRGRASARQIAATGENSGPTTMAPMMRMGWSSSRPAPAISVARVRKLRNAQDSTLSLRTRFSTTSQTIPSSGIPGRRLLGLLGGVGEQRVGLGDHDRALVVQVERAQRGHHRVGALPGHVGHHQRARRLRVAALDHGHVGDRLVVAQQLHDLVGERGGDPQLEVQHAGSKAGDGCRTRALGSVPMETRALDPFDDAQMRAFYDVTWRAEMEDGRPWNIHWTHDELAASLRESPDDHKMEGVQLLDDDGTVLAAGVIGYGLLDNTDKAWVFPMVDPPVRRQGHGTALLEGLIARCHELGRSTVTMNASYAGPEDDDAVPVRFAAANGFHVSNTEISPPAPPAGRRRAPRRGRRRLPGPPRGLHGRDVRRRDPGPPAGVLLRAGQPADRRRPDR